MYFVFHFLLIVFLYMQIGQELINTKDTVIDVSELQMGVYFLQINTLNGLTTKRVIIQ